MYDVAIIGSGIASSLTLCRLADRLQRVPRPTKTLRIAIIEKEDERWTGIPYGQRSSKGALTFQRLSEFLNEPERGDFITWLKTNREGWLTTFVSSGGPTAAKWIHDNQHLMDEDNWGELYLPRFLFGQHISHQSAHAVAQLSKVGLASVTFIHGEAVGVHRRGADPHSIQVEGAVSQILRARRVVLAIGSPPQRSIHPELAADSRYHLHIHNVYSPAEDTNLQKILRALPLIKDRSTANLLIVGSNASALEVLYLLNCRAEVRDCLNSVVVLSRGGRLPHKITGQTVPFELTSLDSLRAAASFNAADLMTAIADDLQSADAMQLNIADLRDPVGAVVSFLTSKLPLTEQKHFVCEYGLSYSRMMRRAGRDTCGAVDELVQLGILTNVKGEFRMLLPAHDGLAAAVYSSAEVEDRITHPALFSITINCGGFEELDFCSSPLINSLLKGGLCSINDTRRGFMLNERLEASEDLYVIGPLVGGNFNDKVRFWHVESASRICDLARQLAISLCESLLPSDAHPSIGPAAYCDHPLLLS